jgi:signal transduction histidine kinase
MIAAMISGPSLVRRIIFRLCLVGIASSVVGYGFLFLEFSTLLIGLKDSTLYSEAEYLVDHIDQDSDNTLTLHLPEDAAALYISGARRYRITAAGLVMGQSQHPPVTEHDIRLSHPGKTTVGFDDLVGVYERPVEEPGHYAYGAIVEEVIAGHLVRVQVERETEHFSLLADTLLDEFFNDGGWLGIPFLVVVGLASILTDLQTLRPLLTLSEQARTIGPTNPSGRLAVKGVPQEVAPLVQAVNDAVERLEHAFEAQRAFTADAAHELRTPLAILQMRLDALQPSDLRRALERDVSVMSRLVDQLLKGARLETVALAADDQVDVSAVAHAVAEALAPVAVSRGISLELTGAEQPVLAHGLPGPLYDALRNLVENALSQTPKGKCVSISISQGSTGRCFLSVADQGPGIAANERPHLFQRFWQGRRKTGGAGLGLSIVQRVADLHQATIDVHDTPGGGATFVFRLAERGKNV